MTRNFMLLCFAVLALSACRTTVDPGDVTVKGDGYEVNVGDDKDSKFCPPGHAKKDWC